MRVRCESCERTRAGVEFDLRQSATLRRIYGDEAYDKAKRHGLQFFVAHDDAVICVACQSYDLTVIHDG